MTAVLELAADTETAAARIEIVVAALATDGVAQEATALALLEASVREGREVMGERFRDVVNDVLSFDS